MSINFFDNYKVTLNSFMVHTPAAKAGGGGGGGTPLFSLSDYVQENRVWFLGQTGCTNLIFSVLNSLPFCYGNHFKGAEWLHLYYQQFFSKKFYFRC